MPTRKQRRRAQKDRRHDYEYETVWVDPVSGEEVEPPEDADEPSPEPKAGKPATQKKKQSGSDRPVKVPPQPSWSRAVKRAGLIGVVIFVAFYLVGSRNGSHDLTSALLISVIYTAIFIPFTYWVDGFTYRRWQRRAEQQGQKRPAQKRAAKSR